jgi:hypothetical protein
MWWTLALSEQLLMLWVASLHWDEIFTASSMLSCKQLWVLHLISRVGIFCTTIIHLREFHKSLG